MVDQFDGDLALINNLTHGELLIENGQAKMDQGLETAVFISLYSGDPANYWANSIITDPDFSYGGKYEELSQQLLPTVENANRLIEAIKNDLKWMKNKGIATNIEVEAEIIGAKEITFTIIIEKPKDPPESFKYSNNWTGQFNNPVIAGDG